MKERNRRMAARRPRAESNSEDGKRGDQEYWNGNSVEFLSGGDTKKDQ